MATLPSDGQLLDAKPQDATHAAACASSILYNLINATTVADTSPWVRFQPFSRAAIELFGSATDAIAVQMFGSTSEENPTDSGQTGSALGSSITALGATFVVWPGIRWVQAVQTGNPTGGTLSVNISAVAP